MDYDGFHQMVLGANLKPMKKGDIMSAKPQIRPLNLVATAADKEGAVPIPTFAGIKALEEEKCPDPRNQEEFDKYFSKRLSSPADKYR